MEGRLEIALSPYAYLDTHVVVMLYGGDTQKLTNEAKRQIGANYLLISPMVMLELQYLFEREKILKDGNTIFSYLSAMIGLDICRFPFEAVTREASLMTWTRDPFDRIITAQAKVNHESMLITADGEIRRNYSRAIW